MNALNDSNALPASQAKIAVVTGAGSGIGRAVAVELLRTGWSVALAGRKTETLEETAALVLEAPSLVVRTDVSRPDDVAALFDAARERFGRLDLLFNNAGTFGPGGVPVEELPYEAWLHVVNTNLNGAFLCAQAAYRQMKEQDPQGGRIINNGSISAHTPRPRSVAMATKHALTGLTKSLSLDGRPYRIACGQIDIGNAATDMTERMRTGALQVNGETTVEPAMDVADVARTVRHMAELPLEANVQFATVLATAMPYVGAGPRAPDSSSTARQRLNLHKRKLNLRSSGRWQAYARAFSTRASHLEWRTSVRPRSTPRGVVAAVPRPGWGADLARDREVSSEPRNGCPNDGRPPQRPPRSALLTVLTVLASLGPRPPPHAAACATRTPRPRAARPLPRPRRPAPTTTSRRRPRPSRELRPPPSPPSGWGPQAPPSLSGSTRAPTGWAFAPSLNPQSSSAAVSS